MKKAESVSGAGTESGGATPTLPPVALLVFIQAAVSAASLVVEIVAGRMLAPYLGMSLYTWTSVIAVVLAGFSAGPLGGRANRRAPTGARALALTGVVDGGRGADGGRRDLHVALERRTGDRAASATRSPRSRR
jgi:hypothetical protein